MRGTKALLKKLDALANAIEADVPKTLEDSVQRRADRVSSQFESAQYTGNNDVVVTMDGNGKTEWSINASGKAVLFIEYGSGVKLPHNSGFGNSGMYPPASWSKEHSEWLTGKRLQRFKGLWPYGGKWVEGNPSANIMYNAEKNLRQNLILDAKDTVKKVLK